MTLYFERVESELPASLLTCPQCGDKPTIYRKTDPWHYDVQTFIACETCTKEWCGGSDAKRKRCLYPADANWQPSLYEAVCVWQTTAKILGSRERVDRDVSF